MESKSISVRIHCPIHSRELIQRVHTDIDPEQLLFCVECILTHQGPGSISSKLIAIPDLIENVAEFYKTKSQTTKTSWSPPQEYLDQIAQQGEKLEKLNKHIEEEKEKVSQIFDSILQDVTKLITDKKNECLRNLDQQVRNLQSAYTSFEKLLKKERNNNDPSRDDLVCELEKIDNIDQLSAFLQSLKGDLKEGTKSEKEIQENLLTMSQTLTEIEGVRPYYSQVGDLPDLKAKLLSPFSQVLGEMLSFKNLISTNLSKSIYRSKFVTFEEFEMVKSWLPKELSKCEPRLIYSAGRDGSTGNAFHKLCDGKKNTLTFVRARFNDSSEDCKIGGFMDSAWHSNNIPIASEKAFIFSITSKNKNLVEVSSRAGFGNPSQGPTFGLCDLVVFSQSKNLVSYVCPNIAYPNSGNLWNTRFYYGNGQANFIAKEVEVYCLD